MLPWHKPNPKIPRHHFTFLSLALASNGLWSGQKSLWILHAQRWTSLATRDRRSGVWQTNFTLQIRRHRLRIQWFFGGVFFFKRTLRHRLLSLQDRRISERHGAALPNAATNWTNRSYATADCHGYGATGLHHTPALPVHNFVLWCHCHWHLFVLVFLPFVFSQANCH